MSNMRARIHTTKDYLHFLPVQSLQTADSRTAAGHLGLHLTHALLIGLA